MKTGSLKKNYLDILSLKEKNSLDQVHENLNFSPKAVKPIMTEQLVTPPARVWNRIEKILDEQEERRNFAKNIITSSFNRVTNSNKRKKMYVAAGVSLLAGIMWVIR